MVPAPGGNGLAMRADLLRAGLARLGDVEVLVVPVFGPAGAEGRGNASPLAVLALPEEPDPVADLRERLAAPADRATAAALHPRPTVCRPATLAGAREVAAQVAGVDLVLVFRLYLAPFLDAVLAAPDRPRVALDLDERDAETQRSLGAPEEADRFARLEAHYVPRVDLVTAAAADDAEAVKARYPLTRVAVVPNAVRPPKRPLGPPPPHGRGHDLLMVGNLGYRPNVEGACWLAGEVVPRLGDVRVAIVGSRPVPDVLALAGQPGITVAGDVESVTPWYRDCRVAVVPLATGGGTRTKVVEALAHRRPVVSTSFGARGLPLGPGSVLLADGPEAFAAACRQLLDDPVAAATLASRGERQVLAASTVEVVASAIETALRPILAR